MADWRLFTQGDLTEIGWRKLEPGALERHCLPNPNATILATHAELVAQTQAFADVVSRGRFSHGKQDKIPRAHTTRAYRLTDDTGALMAAVAVHHSQAFDTAVVHAFLSVAAGPDGLAAAAAAVVFVVCDAIKCGGSLAVGFNPQAFPGGVPAVVRQVAAAAGTKLPDACRGLIRPDEAREILLALTRLGPIARDRLRACHRRGVLSVERVCFLSHRGVWPAVEADTVLTIAPHPELVLGREIGPENGHLHLHALGFGRASVLIGLLARALALRVPPADAVVPAGWTERSGALEVAPHQDGSAVNVRAIAETLALTGWNRPLELSPGTELTVFLRPRLLAEMEAAWPIDIACSAAAAHPRKALLVPYDFALLPEPTRSRLENAATRAGVELLVAPTRVAALDAEIRSRALLARSVRQ